MTPDNIFLKNEHDSSSSSNTDHHLYQNIFSYISYKLKFHIVLRSQ